MMKRSRHKRGNMVENKPTQASAARSGKNSAPLTRPRCTLASWADSFLSQARKPVQRSLRNSSIPRPQLLLAPCHHRQLFGTHFTQGTCIALFSSVC